MAVLVDLLLRLQSLQMIERLFPYPGDI